MPHRYPYLAQDRLLALRLDNDFEMSAGPTPPSGAAGGAGRFKFWMDTSITPPALRMATAARATAGVYVATEWATLATLDLSTRLFSFGNVGTINAGTINAANGVFTGNVSVGANLSAANGSFTGGVTASGNSTFNNITLTGTGYALTVPTGAINVAGFSNFSNGIAVSGTGNSVISVPSGGITVAGASSFPYIYGGVGSAGVLQCWNTPNKVCFRWDGSNLSFRLDEVLENKLAYVKNFNGFQLDAGGGPAGFQLAAYSGSTPFVVLIDVVSDGRLKENVRDTEIDALGAILATPVREFDWNSDGRRYMPFIEPHAPIGLVAQEVQEHMPFVVGVSNYPEKDDVPVHDMHRLMYDRMAAYFVRAIQQLHDEITDLKQRLN